MVKNKKTIKIFISAISAAAAAIMLPLSVFADGILNDMKLNDYTIEIMNKGEKIELVNKPFIENGEVYIPIRETVKILNENAGVEWDNGRVTIAADENVYLIKIGSSEVSFNPVKSDAATYIKIGTNNVILRNDTTFVPYGIFEYMLGDLDKTYEFNYAVYDDAKQYEMTKLWADGLVTRDGKTRYEVMTEQMKEKFIEEQKAYVSGEDWNYVIGYSSPKTVSYNIVSLDSKAKITYYQTDNTNELYVIEEELTIADENGVLRVSDSKQSFDY